MSADLKYRRVLLKISGEALMGEREYGLDPEMVATHRRARSNRCTRSASSCAW